MYWGDSKEACVAEGEWEVDMGGDRGATGHITQGGVDLRRILDIMLSKVGALEGSEQRKDRT